MRSLDKKWTKPDVFLVDVPRLCQSGGDRAQREMLLRVRGLVEHALELVHTEGSPNSKAKLKAIIKVVDATLVAEREGAPR